MSAPERTIRFPGDFWWGAATSGPQAEGRFAKPRANVFDRWYDLAPGDFYGQVGPDVASNFYNSYICDIDMLREVGLNSLRISVQWTRLIADFETGALDQDGVSFYHRVIDALHEAGIRPVLNLHHFDMPAQLLDRYGGWESKHVVERYADYAEAAFRQFGDKVADWFTFNEPMVIVDGGYLYQFHHPKVVDGRKAVQVAYNVALASAKAIERFTGLSGLHPQARIGSILNLTPSYPASDDAEDLAAGTFSDLWCNRLFLDSAVRGSFPDELVEVLDRDGVLWSSTPDELACIAAHTIQVLGVNYYHPHRVSRPDISPDSLTVDWMPGRYFADYEMPGRRMNVDKGWEIYPQALYDIGRSIREDYGNIAWFVSENGIGVSREERYLGEDGVIADDYRIRFMQEHLYWLHRALEEGSNCFGYHVWTGIDCWSWGNAYRNRYGLISNDIHTQIKTIKKSGRWFREVSRDGVVPIPSDLG